MKLNRASYFRIGRLRLRKKKERKERGNVDPREPQPGDDRETVPFEGKTGRKLRTPIKS